MHKREGDHWRREGAECQYPPVRAVRILGMVLAAAVLVGAGPAVSVDGEDQFLAATSTERASRGLPRFDVDPDLSAIARSHSLRMAGAGALFHNDDVAQQTRAWASYAENVASGASVGAAQKALMDSSVHRANILDPDFDDVGMGAAWAGGFVWVTQVFGDRPSQPQPVPTVTSPPTTVVATPVPTLPPVPSSTSTSLATAVTSTTLVGITPAPSSTVGPEPGATSLTPSSSTSLAGPAAQSTTGGPAVTNRALPRPVAPSSVRSPSSGPATTADVGGIDPDTGATTAPSGGPPSSLQDRPIDAVPAGTAAAPDPAAAPRDNRTVIAVVSAGMALAAQIALVLRRRRIWDR